MSVVTLLALAAAGGAGAALRFVLDGTIRSRLRTSLPVSTMVINISGSLLLGILVGVVESCHDMQPLFTIVGVGFLGGYTTFSTASLETVRLIQTRKTRQALISGLGTLVLAVTAAAAGIGIGAWWGTLP
ncbi:CrcB protein [Arthrobacter sp. CAN_A2]|uniref:fluoride efflux transporter CrcB n=1 Tax=Arthrobacter sp. CAN_A2 TaxID=2787718 RepID=UPI0018EF554E